MDVKGGQGWAGSVLATASLVEGGGGLKESHDFGLLCVDLHTISDTPFLADMTCSSRGQVDMSARSST